MQNISYDYHMYYAALLIYRSRIFPQENHSIATPIFLTNYYQDLCCQELEWFSS